MSYRIEMKTIGQCFAVVGVVLDDAGVERARGREVPFGHDGAAYTSAKQVAAEWGLAIPSTPTPAWRRSAPIPTRAPGQTARIPRR